jgi:hypothetical protein
VAECSLEGCRKAKCSHGGCGRGLTATVTVQMAFFFYLFFRGKGPSVERPSRTFPSTRHNRTIGQTSRMFLLAEHT